MTGPHRIAVGLAAVAVAVAATLAGCIDHPPDVAELMNRSDQAVVVTFDGSDRVIELEAQKGTVIAGDECVGTGIVVTAQDGTVLAEFDGGACPTTMLIVHDDGTVTVRERDEETDRPARDG